MACSGLTGLGGLAAAGATWVCAKKTVRFIGMEEQLRVQGLTETKVYNGPGLKVVNLLTQRPVLVKAQKLGPLDYVKVRDTISGEQRVEKGPQLLFLNAYDEVVDKGEGITLSQTEYLIVDDKLSGERKMARGPCVWFPQPHDGAPKTSTAITLLENQYVRVRDELTGRRWIQRGKDLVFLAPTWKVESGSQVCTAWTLKGYEYVRLLDKVTGKVRVCRGEQTVFPGPDEELLDDSVLKSLDLKVDEFVKIEDQVTGEVRVVSGPSRVFLDAHEKHIEGGKKRAVQVDGEHAALVRDTKTGQLRLVTENQLFVPGPTEVIERVQELIKLADHEAMIIENEDGGMTFHYGNPEKQLSQPRHFFLPPYAKPMQLQWSSGLRRLHRDLCIERFDCRAQYMWFEFDCRTSDNVELVLETTFFWEVEDLPKMVRSTGNLPGDIYNQARSQFIKCVAHKTLKQFMHELHVISKEVFDQGQEFYTSRGVKIHSLEVTRYSCADERTSEVLQQIIEETTNRLNRLSQAESENEVKLYRMQGEIEQAKLNADLLSIQQEQEKEQAAEAGANEAERVKAFIQGLAECVPSLEERTKLWQVLRKNDALSCVSQGGATLYYTPSDVNLSIESRPPPPARPTIEEEF